MFRPLLLLGFLCLSGCELFPVSQDAPQPANASISLSPDIETHEFNLSYAQNLVGVLASVPARETDTLSDIARHYGLGFNDITLANAKVEPWALANQQSVLLPLRFILPDAPRRGIVLNLANMRLFFYPGSAGRLLTYPIGIGREGWNTPLGITKITAKKIKPDWTVPASIKREHLQRGEVLPAVIPAGPENPLGDYAMTLGFQRILIHGTNKPYGIGMQVSHGCVQLYPEDIERLFNQVDEGTPVRIVYQPYLIAWEGNMLYVEAHPPLPQWVKQQKAQQQALRSSLEKMATEKHAVVDWQKLDSILQRADGIPTPVLLNSDDLPALTSKALVLEHPGRLLNQPQVTELGNEAWSVLTQNFAVRSEAQKLAAMLNHQVPQIPARIRMDESGYRVVAGPFKDSQIAKLNAKRIKQLFELDATVKAPQNSAYCIKQLLKSAECRIAT